MSASKLLYAGGASPICFVTVLQNFKPGNCSPWPMSCPVPDDNTALQEPMKASVVFFPKELNGL